MMKNLIFNILIILISSNFIFAQADTLTDTRDGKIYLTVKINEQIWMAENLNFVTEKSYCYSGKDQNCNKYGRLYEWDVALNVCPDAWHLPSDEEWSSLEKFLGMTDEEIQKVDLWRGTDQADKLMKDTDIGFNVLLGGYRNPPSNYFLKDMQAFFWTSTEKNAHAWFRQFMTGFSQIYRNSKPKSWAMSVRCIKD